MPDVQTNLALIRMLLDYPTTAQPTDAMLFEFFSNQVIHHQSQLQNSGAPWSVMDMELVVAAGVEDYAISPADFGKPFLVYTEDPTNQYWPRVEIPFSLIQNTDQFYLGPRQIQSTNDNIPRAELFTFYRKPTGFFARVTPIPGGSATYRVWYETSPAAPAALAETPGITPFHHLIRVQTAIAALPYTAWGDLRADAEKESHVTRWERKCRALAAALTRQEEQFQRQFDTYIGTLMQAGMEARDGFGDDYMDDYNWNVGYFGPNQLG